MRICLIVLFLSMVANSYAQSGKEKQNLKIDLNEDGSRYFQFTFLNQTWLRHSQLNPGSLIDGRIKENSFDIGLRRTRIQMIGQLSEKVFVYFQFGQNNFNARYNTNGNRKIAAFFHDALGEYKLSSGNQLKIGAGLTITTGLSRFSQPSIGSIMTMDVPVFAQSTVDQIDQFARKLSVYARGQIGKFDYRLVLSDPFPITSSGGSLPALSANANFAQQGHQLQQAGYLMYQFFEHESHTTPYMAGTYLGAKKVFNIAVGGIYQQDAMWKQGNVSDTVYEDMQHFAVESFLDMPVGSNKAAVSAYVGYFNTNYGTNYLRYNGLMNPANGSTLHPGNSIAGQGPVHGNALPMFGTGEVIYVQFGYLLPEKFLRGSHRIMPYASFTSGDYDRLNGLRSNVYNAGINYYINGHQSKFSLDWQNRPTFAVESGEVVKGDRLNNVVLQYQIYF